ncbi:MAG TPA: hypothetical protein PLW61_03835 [Caldisericia bacterium]|nr:hypothetical protein [Caldisericia bacterium]
MKKILACFIMFLLIVSFLPKIPLSFGVTFANETIIKEIKLTPDMVNETTRVDITFELKTDDLLANSDNLQVYFPIDSLGNQDNEFYIPSTIPRTSVLIDGSNNITDVQVDLLNRRIAVITSINLPKEMSHFLTFLTSSGIKNPKKYIF